MPPYIAEEDIPRTNTPDMDATDLAVHYDGAAGPGGVVVSDGVRFAIYIPLYPTETIDTLSSKLALVPTYAEAGRFREANVVMLTDGYHQAKYIPFKKLDEANRN